MVYKNKNEEIINVKFSERKGKFVIPEFLGEYQCISIEPEEFTTWDELTEVIIPESVTSIGEYAFYKCSSLEPKLLVYDKGKKCYGWVGDEKKCTEVVIPEGVTSIEGWAFYKCHNLTNIKMPKSLTKIGTQAFSGCRLTSINIPEGVTSIGKGAFSCCRSLTNIEIPSSITFISHAAFYECSGLTSVNIHKGITSIGRRAFSGCSGLTSIEIPDSVTSIGPLAFYECNKLANINIPETVISIEWNAFSGCTNLDVKIDNSKDNVKVGSNAFTSCKSITGLI